METSKDDDYESSEDEDFIPDEASSESSDNESDKDYQAGVEQNNDSEKIAKALNTNLDDVWAKMNKRPADQGNKPVLSESDNLEKVGEAGNDQNTTNEASDDQNKPDAMNTNQNKTNDSQEDIDKDGTILIKHEYQFAGETVRSEKRVHKDSAEAKAYLNSLAIDNAKSSQSQTNKPNAILNRSKGPPRKRPSTLLESANRKAPKAMSTLEKSRLDWAAYKDKEGIEDQLRRDSKNSFLDRQDFLHRAEEKRESLYKPK